MTARNSQRLLLVLVLFYLLQVFFYARSLGFLPDESFYVYESYLMATHKIHPYVDKFTGYAPLSYFIPGTVQKFTHPDFFIPRVVTGFVGALVLLLSYTMAKQLGGRKAGIFAALFITLHPRIAQLFSLAMPFALTNFFQLCAFGILLTRLSGSWKAIIASLFMTLALFTRHTLFPGTLVFFIMLIWILGLFPSLLSVTAFICASFVLSVPVFQIDIQRFLIPQLATMMPFVFSNPMTVIPSIDPMRANPKNFVLYVQTFVRHFYLPLMFWGSAALCFFSSKSQPTMDKTHKKIMVSLMVYFAVNFITHAYGASRKFQSISEVPYHIYFIFALLIPASVAAAKILNEVSGQDSRTLLKGLYVAGFALMPLNFGLGLVNFPLNPPPLSHVKDTALKIQQITPSGQRFFFWGPCGYLLYASRETFPPLIYGHNLFITSRDDAQVQKYGYYNLESVHRWLRNESQWAVIFKQNFSLMNKTQSMSSPATQLYIAIQQDLKNHFVLYKIFNAAEDGPVLIYKRKQT